MKIESTPLMRLKSGQKTPQERRLTDFERLTSKMLRVESILILLSVAAIAYGDFLVGKEVSLGYLYLIPLSYSALTHSVAKTVGLIVLCVVLRQWLGPLETSPGFYFLRDWVLTAIFLAVVTVLHRLGKDRRQFFETARQQRDQLEREVELAAEVQGHLLGKHLPPNVGFDMVARTWPAKVVGGDYYDFLNLGDGQLAVVIADVSGKGLPAAMVMPAAQIGLRTLAASAKQIDTILEELNGVLYEATASARYATLFYGALDFHTGNLRYITAGHLPGLLLRSSSAQLEVLAEGGPPVGLFESVQFKAGETRIEPGDLLVLYTDGVVEAANCQSELYGEERLRQLLKTVGYSRSNEIVELVYNSVQEFACSRALADDLTVIAIRRPQTHSETGTSAEQ